MSRRGLALGVTLVALALPGSAGAFGTFATAVDYGAGSDPGDVEIGKFNGDTANDLVVAVSGQLALLKNNGDGTFGSPGLTNSGSPRAIDSADLDRDGDLDVVGADGPADSVHVALGDGIGGFTSQGVNLDAYATDVVIARLNRDRKLDVAVTQDNDRVAVLLGRGNGTLRAPRYIRAGDAPTGIAAADLNGDGKRDLVVANIYAQSVSVLRGRGNGTFRRPRAYPVGRGAQYPAIADFNDDGRPEVAVTHYAEPGVSVLRGKRGGRLGHPRYYETTGATLGVIATDLNRDGRPDIAAADIIGASVLLCKRDGTMRRAHHYETGTYANGIAAGRLNGDQGPDLAVTNEDDANVSVLLNLP